MASSSAWPSQRLIVAAQRGDQASIAALVGGSHRHVQRFAFSLCATPQDAEDAAQEALIILFRKIGTLKASGALASWMFQIVRHECLRRAKLLARRGASFAEEHLPSAEDDVMRRLELDRVVTAITALPPDQRQVLIMRDVQGLPGGVVARSLGLSTAAMKSRLHRPRHRARQPAHRSQAITT